MVECLTAEELMRLVKDEEMILCDTMARPRTATMTETVCKVQPEGRVESTSEVILSIVQTLAAARAVRD